LRKKKMLKMLMPVISLSVVFGLASGIAGGFAYERVAEYLGATRERVVEKEYIPQTTQEQKVIDVVRNVSPSVVSIVISKDVPVLEQFFTNPFEGIPGFPLQLQIPQLRQKGVEKKEVGGGSGFLVSPDGLVVTNKHVVLDQEAEYTVLTNDGKSYPAKVLAKDPFQDLAVLKIQEDQIFDATGLLTHTLFPAALLGNSDALEIGQTVIAIGNALGEFRNTISVGVVSGLSRTITASGGSSFVETIEDVIQTDAAINKGNSGGPLLNLAGEVIGINTATVLQAQSIGFAIPANKAKKGIEQVKTLGKIVYPSLGVRYVLVDSGALVSKSLQGDPAVVPGSAAQIAGIQEGDIILELNKEKITKENSLGKVIQKYNPGDVVTIKLLRGVQERIVNVTLGERSE
jgi:S1-C subfamily serine protease